MDPIIQIILTAFLGLFGAAFLALQAWSLKVQVDTRSEIAGLREWRKSVDARLQNHADRHREADQRMDTISDRVPKHEHRTAPVTPLRPPRRKVKP